MADEPADGSSFATRILPVDISKIGRFSFNHEQSFLHDWDLELDEASADTAHLVEAAEHLRAASVPVAFPTETVYGLGADATSSAAVRAIYTAKQRPSDNPLIVHICSLSQLRGLLGPGQDGSDSIPAIYQPLIRHFWPGPLTILLPVPSPSKLAPEVTAGLPTFGARMPSSRLALALIKLVDRPLAAPSANASTKPSPTAAEHVLHDLNGRIEIILNGGRCSVGVESTVVDGLSTPPAILRPGGVSIKQLQTFPGWEDVVVGYEDGAEKDKVPRAPGMKYKHYSPKAKVVLVASGVADMTSMKGLIEQAVAEGANKIGILRTKHWSSLGEAEGLGGRKGANHSTNRVNRTNRQCDEHMSQWFPATAEGKRYNVVDLHLGETAPEIARNLFGGLRSMDMQDVNIIFIEGIDDSDGETAAAVMNRLRKAAEVTIDHSPAAKSG